MSLYAVTIVGECVRPVWVRAADEATAREKAAKGEYTPGGPWTPLYPDQVVTSRVVLAAGEED